MIRYAATADCRMAFLRRSLDDPTVAPCGICDRCAEAVFAGPVDAELRAAARRHLRTRPVVIEPRRQWPSGRRDVRGKIAAGELIEPGRALGRTTDDEFGRLLRKQFDDPAGYGEELITELVAAYQRWNPTPPPSWVCHVPAERAGDPVGALAEAFAQRAGLPFHPVVTREGAKRPQSEMRNSATQVGNVVDAFRVGGLPDTRPVLLIDDLVDSRWTITVVARQLRRAGCTLVHPLALTLGPR